MTAPSDARHLIRLAQDRAEVLATASELEIATRDFREHGHLKLASLLSPSLWSRIVDRLDRTTFVERVHHGIGRELCAVPGAATGVLQFLINDPHFLSFMARLTSSGPVGCFSGRVYRLAASEGHYDSWHDDIGEHRLVAMSLNLGRDPFEGGELQLRRRDSETTLAEVRNPTPGDAVIFRIAPDLQHRVAPVRGTVARTAYAGWFRSEPDYRTLLDAELEGRDA